MSKAKLLLQKLQGQDQYSLMSKITRDGNTYSYHQLHNLLLDWALNTAVCFQITAVLAQAWEELKAHPDLLIPDHYDLATARFTLKLEGWWKHRGENKFLVVLYPSEQADERFTSRSTNAVIGLTVKHQRITACAFRYIDVAISHRCERYSYLDSDPRYYETCEDDFFPV